MAGVLEPGNIASKHLAKKSLRVLWCYSYI